MSASGPSGPLVFSVFESIEILSNLKVGSGYTINAYIFLLALLTYWMRGINL